MNSMHSQWHVTARSLRSSVCVAVTTPRTGALSGCLLEASRATVVEYNVEPRVLADVYGLPMHSTGLRYRGTGHWRRNTDLLQRILSRASPTDTGVGMVVKGLKGVPTRSEDFELSRALASPAHSQTPSHVKKRRAAPRTLSDPYSPTGRLRKPRPGGSARVII